MIRIRKEGGWLDDFQEVRDQALEEGEASIEEEIHPLFDTWCPKKTGQMVGSWDVRRAKKQLVISYYRLSEEGKDIAERIEADPDFPGRVPGTGGRPLGRAFDAGAEKVIENINKAYFKEALG